MQEPQWGKGHTSPLARTQNFHPNLKFSPEPKIFAWTQNFRPNLKFSPEPKIFARTQNFHPNPKFSPKPKIQNAIGPALNPSLQRPCHTFCLFIECGDNERYDRCLHHCQGTCEEKHVPCTRICVPGCVCDTGYIRADKTGDSYGPCIPKQECTGGKGLLKMSESQTGAGNLKTLKTWKPENFKNDPWDMLNNFCFHG